MATFTADYDFTGRTLIDRDGSKLGKIEGLYDTGAGGRDGLPEWALLRSGMLGLKTTMVPLRDARPDGEHVRLPLERARVKGAPQADGELSAEEEQRLFAYYGQDPRAATEEAGRDRARLQRHVAQPRRGRAAGGRP